MIIIVNATEHKVQSTDLAAALAELGYTGQAIATAVNGSFVAAADRAGTPLRANDRVEVLAPMQGG